ncbi:MAG: formate dehydrogenase accessory protein FdhE [Rhodospirillaceae bacterium]
MTSAVHDALDRLVSQRPEWVAWLTLVGVALDEAQNGGWNAIEVRRPATNEDGAPLLAGATIAVDRSAAERLFDALTADARYACIDRLAVLEAALNRDGAWLWQHAPRGAEARFGAIASLAAIPLLRACARVLQPVPVWTHGYCPICGGWPTFVEVRGIDRARYLRCSACGGEWRAAYLQCPFCGNDDHDRLGALVADDAARSAIEVCNACGSYVKVFTVLRGWAAGEVMIQDLATTELDIVAAEQGYARTRDAYALHLKLTDRAARDIAA